MVLTVLKPGIQATLQAAPRRGMRHLGVPASGAADPLSMAFANRLVGNPSDTCAVEMPFGMAAFQFETACAVGFAGAHVRIEIDGREVPMHQRLHIRAGEQVSIGAPETGVRIYMAIQGGFSADAFLGSLSTCLPAGFGGLSGRALRAGDRLACDSLQEVSGSEETPAHLRQPFSHTFALRCVPGPDVNRVPDWSAEQAYVATRRADRTGIEVTGPWPKPDRAALKPSAPVFPGAVQLTPSGNAFVLMPDSQTTGGYPHILQISRADRHLLGQIRPGDRIHFLKRTSDEAAKDLRQKTEWFRDWLPDIRF